MLYSFKKGLNNVKSGDIRTVRRELKAALGITSRNAFNARMRGEIEPKVSEAEAIEVVFEKYGVSKTQVWGE